MWDLHCTGCGVCVLVGTRSIVSLRRESKGGIAVRLRCPCGTINEAGAGRCGIAVQ